MDDCCIDTAQGLWNSLSLGDDDTTRMEECTCGKTVNIMVEVYDPEE